VVVRDITEEVRTLEATQASEEHFRRLFDAAPIGIALIDSNRLISDANAGLSRVLGTSSEALIGRNLVSFVHEASQAIREGLLAEMVEGPLDYFSFDRLLMRADGTELWTRQTTSAVRDADGGVLYAIRTVEDITDLKNAELEIRESEARHRQLFAAAPIGITFTDEDRVIIDANPALAEFLGTTEDERIGKRVGDFVAPDWLPAGVRPYDQMVAGEIARGATERIYVRSDGARVWGQTTASAVRDDDGNFLYGIRTIEDITERKAAEEERLETDQRFRSLFEMAAIGLAFKDVNNHNILVNPEMQLIFGRSTS
jgi:PAS domain S-box-containing protein